MFALGTSTGSQLLGNSKLLAREMNTFLSPQECSLDRNQRLQMVTLEKSWGPTVSVRILRQSSHLGSLLGRLGPCSPQTLCSRVPRVNDHKTPEDGLKAESSW